MNTLTPDEWDEIASEVNPDALFIGNPDERPWLDKAIIGFGGQHGTTPKVTYNYDWLVSAFAQMYVDNASYTDEAAAYEAALEWVDANVACAYMGPETPIIVQPAVQDA